jgi:hypothetical protein
MVIVSSSMFVTFIPIYYRENRTPDFFSLSFFIWIGKGRAGLDTRWALRKEWVEGDAVGWI